MITIKQLEGFYWAARLGGFLPASEHLNTTQSAISKRVQELEAHLGTALFDRSKRSIRLTNKGGEVFALARDLIAMRNRILDAANTCATPPRQLRIGVTELTAKTWLPALVERIRGAYPNAILAPEVDTSTRLVKRLRAGKLDVAICPDAFSATDMEVVALGSVEYVWVCNPSYLSSSREMTLNDIAEHTIIEQAHESGLGDIIGAWLADQSVSVNRSIVSSNLTALEALTLSGLGVSYLPRQVMAPLIAAGRLNVLRTDPPLPRIPYVMMMRKADDDEFLRFVSSAALSTCDFSRT